MNDGIIFNKNGLIHISSYGLFVQKSGMFINGMVPQTSMAKLLVSDPKNESYSFIVQQKQKSLHQIENCGFIDFGGRPVDIEILKKIEINL